MGAAEAALLAPAEEGPSAAQINALVRRYGGAGGDDDKLQEPECPVPSDDYDPRKPEYILQSTEEQREHGQVLQLQQQMQRLQAALSKRQLDPSSHVVRHYEQVLQEMRLAVEGSARRRSSSDALCDDALLSSYNGCLARLLDLAREVKVLLDKELSGSMAAHIGNIAPRLAIEAQPRCPTPPLHLEQLPGDTSPAPATLSPVAEASARLGAAAAAAPAAPLPVAAAEAAPAATEVQYYWVQSGARLNLSRIEMRSAPTRTACSIPHCPSDRCLRQSL